VTRIRKEGKAQWVYHCELCNDHVKADDHFRAVEYQQAHERTLAHAFKLIGEAFQPVIDAYVEMARTIIETTEQLQKAQLPPANIPHDPGLRRDRRKWGGR